MKQRINAEQLQELSKEQKISLKEWCKPQFGDVLNSIKCGEVVFIYANGQDRLNFDSDGYEWDIKENCLPLLSIGQMIEILQGKSEQITTCYNEKGVELMVWTEFPKQIQHISGRLKLSRYKADSYCDALWQAVKEVL